MRFLKGLIEQNSSKKYFLTEEGRKALDVLFQDSGIANEPLNQLKDKKLEGEVRNQESNSSIEETAIQVEQDIATISEENVSELVERVEPSLEPSSSSSSIKVLAQTRAENYFNVNQLINSIPRWVYITNFFVFFTLPIILFFIQPKVVFFHFIPIKISNPIFSFVMFIFPIFNFIILFIISIIKQEQVKISTAGILVMYYNTVFVLTIIFNLFNLFENSTVLHVFSILIQGLFIIFWTLSISLQYYSWERSVFLAIVQNYILFLFF